MKKVGSYSVTSIDFNTWFVEDNTVKVIPKNKKQKNKKKIIYPIFLELATVTNDIYWTKKFNIWATGKIPKFFQAVGNEISYIKNNTIIASCLLDNDVNTNMKNCVQFFKTYGGFFSKNDEKEIDEDEELSSDITSDITEPECKTWSQSDKKSQELMLKKYSNDLTEMMKLSHRESNLLLQTLRLAVSAKNFNKNNMILDQGKIIDIKGLLYDNNTKLFKIDYTLTSVKMINKKIKDSDESSEDDIYVSEYAKDMIPQFNQKITKYYELYEKKYAKYQK
jgi:hypothetical protein